MPTTRRRSVRGRTVLTLDSFNGYECISFFCGYVPANTPFEQGRQRWRSEDDFLSDYRQVRDEVLALGGRTPFAEELLQQREAGRKPS